MAIIAFTLIAILGLVPTALSDLNAAEKRTAEARILQAVAAEYEFRPWSAVSTQGVRDTFYFDERGVLLGGLDDKTYYVARVTPALPSQSPDSQEGSIPVTAGKILLPGETEASPYLVRLKVSITDRPRDPMAFTADEKERKRQDHALILVNPEPEAGVP